MKTFAYRDKQRRAKRKKNVVITLDPELVERAHKLSLNLSKISEFALDQAEEVLSGKGIFRALNPTIWSLGRDLNPRLPPYQGGALTGLGHRGSKKRIGSKLILSFCSV